MTTTTNDQETKEELFEKVEQQAEWRDRKAEQHPHDARNARSAESLRRLAGNLAALPDDDPHWRVLASVWSNADADTTLLLCEAQSETLRTYGFYDEADGDAEVFLDDLMIALRGAVEEHQEATNLSIEAAVQAAADPDSPVHALLEWDDSKAAHEHRLTTMRIARNSLRIQIVNVEGTVEHIRPFIKSISRGIDIPIVEATDSDFDAEEKAVLADMARKREQWKSVKLARTVVQAIGAVIQQAVRSGDFPPEAHP